MELVIKSVPDAFTFCVFVCVCASVHTLSQDSALIMGLNINEAEMLQTEPSQR